MAATSKTLINGQAFSYVDMSFAIDSIPLAGFKGVPVKSISYNMNQQKSVNYENSKFGTSISYGKISVSGSVTFSLDSFEVLRRQIYALTGGFGSIVDLAPVYITISYANKGKSSSLIIKHVIFTSENTSGSEGDDTFGVSCDFIAVDVVHTPMISLSAITLVTPMNLGDNQSFL